jgi:hypothetical protein
MGQSKAPPSVSSPFSSNSNNSSSSNSGSRIGRPQKNDFAPLSSIDDDEDSSNGGKGFTKAVNPMHTHALPTPTVVVPSSASHSTYQPLSSSTDIPLELDSPQTHSTSHTSISKPLPNALGSVPRNPYAGSSTSNVAGMSNVTGGIRGANRPRVPSDDLVEV